MANLHRQRILVVDDDPAISEVVGRYLERESYEVEVALDGAEALERAREHSPDLVVLDLMLPRIDGLEVFRQLRTQSSVPVIMLTAKGEEYVGQHQRRFHRPQRRGSAQSGHRRPLVSCL